MSTAFLWVPNPKPSISHLGPPCFGKGPAEGGQLLGAQLLEAVLGRLDGGTPRNPQEPHKIQIGFAARMVEAT
jgi:hypothetical protein